MMLIAAVPGYVLGRWFDRQPARMGGRRPDARSARELPQPQWCPHEGPSRPGVAKAFGPQPVLRGVDLSVAGGFVHRHPRRVGKRQDDPAADRGGFERPDDGEVRHRRGLVDDAGRRFVPSERRRIGYVPQEGALFPHLSVGRNVAFGLPRGPHRRDRVDELLELVGLSGYRRRYPHQLSGGQQQRVALARALAIGPEVVLLDEPFSSLDAAMRSSVRADVHAVLRQAGTTSILVTHDQDEALSMADQVAVLRHGVIAQLDTPAGAVRPARRRGAGPVPGGVERPRGRGPRGPRPRTALGDLAGGRRARVAGRGRPARVMVRPEQIRLDEAARRGVGHGAELRVLRPRCGRAGPARAERPARAWSSGSRAGMPLEPGRRVGLSVLGAVVVWPRECARRREFLPNDASVTTAVSSAVD